MKPFLSYAQAKYGKKSTDLVNSSTSVDVVIGDVVILFSACSQEIVIFFVPDFLKEDDVILFITVKNA